MTPSQSSKRNARRRNKKNTSIVPAVAAILPRRKLGVTNLNTKMGKLSVAGSSTPIAISAKGAGQVRDPFGTLHRQAVLRTASLTTSERDFVVTHLDPCGEYETNVLNARVPDGAIPQSSALELREVAVFKVPGSDPSTLALDGRMWTLVLYHWPFLRTPVVAIATTDNAEPTREQVESVYHALGQAADLSIYDYPNWVQTDETPVYCSIIRWTALRSLPAPSAEVQWISQYRITADGMTVFDNTPDLINQGIVVGAQFNCDSRFESTGEDFSTVGTSVLITLLAAPSSSYRDIIVSWPLPLANGDTATQFNFTSIGPTATTQTASIVFSHQMTFLPSPGSAGVVVEPDIVYTLSATAQLSTGPSQTIVVELESPDSPPVLVFTATWTNNAFTVTTYTTRFVTVDTGINDHIVVGIPSSGLQELTQETAKTVQMTMKEDNGFYMVKRVWQPIFNMTATKDFGQIYFDTPSISTPSVGGGAFRDSLDKNYGVGVTSIASIPYACQPMIKLYRVVEIVAGPQSPYGPFMTATPDRNELVQCLVRDFSDKSPFMYPESFNVFDKLFGVIQGVLNGLPKVFANVPVIGDIVTSVFGKLTANSPDKSAVNHLVSAVNPDTMEKLVQQLLAELLP